MEQDKEVQKFLKHLEASILPKPSKVSRNKNYRTISVSNAFDFNRIPIKVIASYEIWKEFEQKCLENDFKIECKDIKQYIDKTTSKNTISELEQYSKEFPEIFEEHFYWYYIDPSQDLNPLVTKKPRGGSPYGLSKSEMWKVKKAARHLYVYLSYWLEQDQKNYPTELKACLKKYAPSDINNIKMTAWEIIESRFEIGLLDGIEDYQIFYDKYIAYQSLDNLKKAYQKKNYSLFAKPLLDIFLNS